MDNNEIDPLALMWTDPHTVAGYWNSLPEDEQEMVKKVAVDFSNSVNNSFDALLGKDAHIPARIALAMTLNVAMQADILITAGFELDSFGAPLVLSEDEGTDEEDISRFDSDNG